MKKILISNPRYGSTCATKVFHRYCEKHQPSIKATKLGYDREFLLMNDGTYTHRLPLDLRIWMIELQREKGKELLYQLHSLHLFYEYKDGIVLDWFKEFYKDSEIYTLRRKDLWHALLSLIVHWNSDNMPNKRWHWRSDHDVHNLREWYKKNPVKKLDILIDPFIKHIGYLDIIDQEIETKKLWLEDLDLSFLNVEVKVDTKPHNLNYEEFFNESELEHIRARLREHKAPFHF